MRLHEITIQTRQHLLNFELKVKHVMDRMFEFLKGSLHENFSIKTPPKIFDWLIGSHVIQTIGYLTGLWFICLLFHWLFIVGKGKYYVDLQHIIFSSLTATKE